MRNLLLFTFLTLRFCCFSQNFQSSAECQRNNNVNCSPQFENNIRATFRYRPLKSAGGYGGCTGTLINRDVSQGDLGVYFISARHCIVNDRLINQNFDVDFNKEWIFFFNYQSPDCNDESILENKDGSHYKHFSKVELVEDLRLNDMALFRMVTPPPPYFNVYYAGWSASKGQALQLPYHVYHHPKGDIKKSAYGYAIGGVRDAPVCHTITRVVDVVYKIFIGWWTKTEIRTSTLCSYVESPFYTVGHFNQGHVEEGSSGSSLINNDGKIIGVLYGSITGFGCGLRSGDNFGKLSNGWNRSSKIRNTLRPNAPFIDFTPSLNGRQISCYENLDMNAERYPWIYYPAKDYQPTNHIGLRANNNITFSGDYSHNFKPESEFSFRAGNNIKLSGDMKIQGNTSFKIGGGCSVSRPAPVELKLQKEPMVNFNPNEYLNQQLNVLQNINVYPNPADATLTITSNSSMDGVQYELYNSQNENIKSGTVENNQIVTSDVSNGMYILKIITPTHVYSHRIEIRR